MDITLYTANGSIGSVSHLALEESGLGYQCNVLDFSEKQQTSAEYMKVNAKARVPSLIVDEGILTETPAILTYIAQVATSSCLALPENAYSQAKINEFNTYLCSTVHVAHAHKMRGHRWVDDEAAKKMLTANVPKTMAICADFIESNLLGTPWVHGDQYSISDPYLYRVSTWLKNDGVEIDNYPKLKAHKEAMEARPAVQVVNAFYEKLS